MKICIYGGAAPDVDKALLDASYEVGRRIAERGHTLVFGGGRAGSMGACANGVIDRGGVPVSVYPEFMMRFEPHLSDDTTVITTKTMAERKQLMIGMSDAFIVLPGGVGTLDEFFETVVLKELGLCEKPIVLLNTEGFYNPLVGLMRQYAAQGFIHEYVLAQTDVAETPEDALRFAEKAMKDAQG
ncbi:MAG: TIGR00730 family Rossman fold protein [Lachnospiraceae bacterium]|nr:TIGR00730 family Rossman fold protein [Lachnospiraceae bacterium]